MLNRALQQAWHDRITPQKKRYVRERQALACKKYRAQKNGKPWPPIVDIPVPTTPPRQIIPSVPPPPPQSFQPTPRFTKRTPLEHLDLQVSLDENTHK